MQNAAFPVFIGLLISAAVVDSSAAVASGIGDEAPLWVARLTISGKEKCNHSSKGVLKVE